MPKFSNLIKNVKNIFLGDRKEEDLVSIASTIKAKEPKKNVNDMGVDPNEWFETDRKYDPPVGEYLPEVDAPVDDWFVEEEKPKQEYGPKTLHEHMYEIATSRYNPFSLGGSENCDSDIDCNIQKHSPWGGGSENFQGGSERIR